MLSACFALTVRLEPCTETSQQWSSPPTTLEDRVRRKVRPTTGFAETSVCFAEY